MKRPTIGSDSAAMAGASPPGISTKPRLARIAASMLFAALLALSAVQLASAHAEVDEVQWDNASHPTKVNATAVEEIADIPGTYSLKVYDSSDVQVDLGDTTIDPLDATKMSVSVTPGLPPGLYRVDWETVSADDGDEDSGSLDLLLTAPVGGSVTLLSADGTAGDSPWRLPLLALGAVLLGSIGAGGLALSRRRGGSAR